MLNYYHRHLPNLAHTLEPLDAVLSHTLPDVSEKVRAYSSGTLPSSEITIYLGHYHLLKRITLK